MFSDAISFSLSNRQNAPLIKVAMSTDVLAALLNAAIQEVAGVVHVLSSRAWSKNHSNRSRKNDGLAAGRDN